MRIDFQGDIAKEHEAYLAVCRRLLRWGDENLQATVHVHPRDMHGWLEWLLVLRRSDASLIITIGMIQRTPEAEFEFHS